jgi:hypothetical protein
MAEGIPNVFIETSAPVEADQLTGTDVGAHAPAEAAPDAEIGDGGTSLAGPLPDLFPRRTRMANGGIVRGEVVPAIKPSGEYL